MNHKLAEEPTHLNIDEIPELLKKYFNLEVTHKEIIGVGSFGKILKIQTEDEKIYAIKAFYSHFEHAQRNPDSNVLRHKGAVKEYIDNLHVHYNKYKNEFIVNILKSKNGGIIFNESYLMDYAGEENIRDLINNNYLYDKKDYPEEYVGHILENYAQMLKKLHDKNYLFLDVDWGSVFFNKETKKITVTDIDSIAPLEDINKVEVSPHPWDPGMLIDRPSFPYFGKGIYKNKEIFKRLDEDENDLIDMTFNSELQSFSLMIDHLINGSTLMSSKFPESKSPDWRLEYFLLGKEYFREKINYTKDRYGKIPKNLRSIVRGMLKPNPNIYTANDFISAIKEDYKI